MFHGRLPTGTLATIALVTGKAYERPVAGLPVPATLRVKAEDAGIVWERDKLLVAKVLKIEKHPDPEVLKLKLVTLDYGAPEPKTRRHIEKLVTNLAYP